MTADHDQVGGAQTVAEKMNVHDGTGFEVFALPGDDDEAIGTTEGSDGTRAFAHRIGD